MLINLTRPIKESVQWRQDEETGEIVEVENE